jgi:RNA polymerase sigma-70 factor (ECF subfamily)
MMIAVNLEAEYRAHAVDLVRYATVLVGPHDAPDVVSEAVAATMARNSLAGVDDVRAYWFRAVSNTALSWHRSAFRRRDREQRASALERPDEGQRNPTEARTILSPLSVQQRAVVYLTYWHDWTPDQIADALGVSDGTVRKQLARSRAHLREVLDHD